MSLNCNIQLIEMTLLWIQVRKLYIFWIFIVVKGQVLWITSKEFYKLAYSKQQKNKHGYLLQNLINDNHSKHLKMDL